MPRSACRIHVREVPGYAALLALLLASTACSETAKPARSERVQRDDPGSADKLTTSTTPAAAQPTVKAGGQLLKLSPSALGTHSAQVTANGSGCPAGSWKAEVGADGKTFTVSFPDYAASLERHRGVSVKDCQVALQLRSDRPVSYALSSLALEGEAQLPAGADAKLMAGHYQQGKPSGDEGAQTQLQGPSKAPFVLADSLGDDRKSWSECGVDRDINVSTRVRLKSAADDGEAHVRPHKLVLAIAERACEAK